MDNQLTPEQVRRLRSHAQGLDAKSSSDVAQVIRGLCGLQSQELSSANLAVRARSNGLTVDDVKHAREVERSIVLTWAMRGTRHLVAAEDVGWQLRLFGPLFIRKSERRYKQLKLDAETRRKAAKRIRQVLSNRGPLNRAELAEVLAVQGIPVEGQAIIHLLGYTALKGIICFGPERDGELTYVVLQDWLKSEYAQQFTDEQLPAEVARRYLQAYAPATPYDLASWSGLTVGQAKAGFEAISDDLVEMETPYGIAWMLKRQWEQIGVIREERSVRFLPRYDNYLLGYESRAFMVREEFAKEIHPGGGLIRSAVIVDGQARATWRMEHRRDTSTILVQPFQQFDPQIVPHLEAEAQDIGRFLSLNTRLSIERQ